MTNYKNRMKTLNDKKQIKTNDYVLYWMQASQRTTYNHALNYAIELSNTLQKPLIVYFALTDNFPEANFRHYYFMLEGLLEVKHALNRMGIKFIIQQKNPIEGVDLLSQNACAVITDRGYLKIQKKWRSIIAAKINCQMIQLESDIVVPVETVSSKEEYAAYTIRKKINNVKYDYLMALDQPSIEFQNNNKTYPISSLKLDTTDDLTTIISQLAIDTSVKQSIEYIGGMDEAKKRLDTFINHHLKNYSELSNDPAKDINSKLSPYLHFGQISPIEIALIVDETTVESKEDFLEQLIVRRELAINFVFYNEQYDGPLEDILPDWTLKTLEEHVDDQRDYEYDLETFEKAKTHDDYWNAAQKELVKTGLMHNYMRMYWGKKVIEWTKDYAQAFEMLIYLNNKYALDGRDPNSYTGIAWCFGKHDRAWKERKIFGKIRYMNANGLERKFNIQAYLKKIENL